MWPVFQGRVSFNKLRNLTASLLKETCHGVATEPSLQPVTSETFNLASANKQDGAHLDIVASGLGGSAFERAFFDAICSPLLTGLYL